MPFRIAPAPTAWPAGSRPATVRIIDALMILYYGGLAVSGVSALLIEPAPAISRVLGYAVASCLYAAGLALFAVGAFIARLRRAVQAEATFMLVLAAATALHGAMVIVGSDDLTGIQTGSRLMVAPLMMTAVALAMTRPTVRVEKTAPHDIVTEEPPAS